MFRPALLASLLFACTTTTPDAPTANLESDSDSDDYSSWFEGMSQPDIEDFERQDDADQLAYPTSEPEPDHDEARIDHRPTTRRDPAFAAGSGSATLDGGFSVDATIDSPIDATIDARVDASLDASFDAPADAGVDAPPDANSCPSFSASLSLMLGVTFDVGVRDQFLGSFGPIREHNIWARGNATGSGNLTLAGSISSTPSSWTVTIAVDGSANATANVHADQELVSRRRREWFALGDAALSGNVSFRDSVTFTQTCDPPGVVATTPGTPAIGVNVAIDELRFYGYFFPRIQGPIAQRIRGAIAQFARNFLNRQLAGLIQSRVLTANQAYAAKKAELLSKLVAKLPAGCGCPIRN